MNIYTCEKTKLGTPDGNPWRYDRICGPYWRIYWNDAPGASVTGGRTDDELGPDRVVALAPRTVYSTRAESPSTHFYMHFTEDAPYSELKPGVFVFEEPRLVELAREIAGELDGSEGLPTRLMLKANIYLSEALLAIPPERMPEERPLDRRVKRALDLMDGRPGISLEELAGELNMCRNAFINLFRRETGATPQKTAMKRRRSGPACSSTSVRRA
jgi:hypothetical protein